MINESIMPLSELNYILTENLDPRNDYNKLIQVNKYYKMIIENDKIYKEFREFNRVLTDKFMENEKSGVYYPYNEFFYFQFACEWGYKNVAKYKLLKITENKIDFRYGIQYNIPYNIQCAFNRACSHGHKNIAEWLYSLRELRIYKKLSVVHV